MRLVTPATMRKIEEEADRRGLSYDTMMERAGQGLSSFLSDFASRNQLKEILFLCGSGNNAGDCFVAAQILASQFQITICMVSGVTKTRLAYAKFKRLTGMRILTDFRQIEQAVQEAQLIVDGVFGTGFHDTLSPQLQRLFALAEQKLCVAVDIPSGGNGLTGEASPGTIHCDYTVTFAAGKYGMMQEPLLTHCGDIVLIDMGIPEQIFEQMDYQMYMLAERDIHELLPARPLHGQKGMFGRLLCVAGSTRMPGAALLAGNAAIRCGVGTICLASVPDACHLMVANTPEAMILPLSHDENGTLTEAALPTLLDYAQQCSAVLIGCGLGQSESVKNLVCGLIEQLECPMILDADGLNVIASCIDILQKAKAPIIITPHPGEMSRLLNCSIEEVQKNRLDSARSLAQQYDITVVLKGAGTIIATQNRAYINTTGNSGMSKGGSGDVLAGMIGSLIAQGIDGESSARIAVYLHGLAGDVAAKAFSRRAMLPRDIIRQLPKIFAQMEQVSDG